MRSWAYMQKSKTALIFKEFMEKLNINKPYQIAKAAAGLQAQAVGGSEFSTYIFLDFSWVRVYHLEDKWFIGGLDE